jgi:hypothetical protein
MQPSEVSGTREQRIDHSRAVIIEFLQRCNRYAEDKLAAYGARMTPNTEPDLALKILQWSSYRAFNSPAIGELERGELDDWLAPPSRE